MLWDDSLRLEQAMWNLTCCDQKILLVLMWAVLSRIKIEEISYWKLLAQGGEGGGLLCGNTSLNLTHTSRTISASTNTHVFTDVSYHISMSDCGATGHHPTKLREMTIRITLWRLWERKPHKEIFCSKIHKVLLNF